MKKTKKKHTIKNLHLQACRSVPCRRVIHRRHVVVVMWQSRSQRWVTENVVSKNI